jgi:hypothetical protein
MLSHNFRSVQIDQVEEDQNIFGVIVPKGFVNISQMCQAHNKLLNEYFRNKDTLSFFIAFLEAEIHSPSGTGIILADNHSTFRSAKELGLASGILIETKNAIGGKASIFAHYELAIDVARWISPELRVWSNRVLRLVVEGDFQALTLEAKQTQEKIQNLLAKFDNIWEIRRSKTISAYWLVEGGAIRWLETRA